MCKHACRFYANTTIFWNGTQHLGTLVPERYPGAKDPVGTELKYMWFSWSLRGYQKWIRTLRGFGESVPRPQLCSLGGVQRTLPEIKLHFSD